MPILTLFCSVSPLYKQQIEVQNKQPYETGVGLIFILVGAGMQLFAEVLPTLHAQYNIVLVLLALHIMLLSQRL